MIAEIGDYGDEAENGRGWGKLSGPFQCAKKIHGDR
jgi:hypothetical protein